MRSGASIAALLGASLLGLSATTERAAGEHGEDYPDTLTLEYDESTIKDYQPQFVLDGVDPLPSGFYALHATSSEHDVNVVAGFTLYAQQTGVTSADSHLGDHEPFYTFYDPSDGQITAVRYAGYHWFRATANREALQIADPHRPIVRVHPDYHHYQVYTGDKTGDLIETKGLLGAIDGWLDNGLEDDLALSQPHNPYAMIGRESWWRHTTDNWLNASLKALFFNLGLSPRAGADSDLQEVQTW